ncbi:MAG: hypothetical protein HFG34_06835 [Eubacterium sp.]|nr:hypothetical protein [Eubacterium sp.]
MFWNEKWNHDIDFSGAFHESCVWYFRKVIDEIGKRRMQKELNRLAYGNCDISFYGKTGMGKAAGIVVDAWFTGFEKSAEETIYYCVYLGRTDDKNVFSAVAKEIAFRLVSDYYRDIYNKNIDKK